MTGTDIALYLPYLRGGGAERVMVNLANGFARQRFNIDLVLASAEGPYLEEVSSCVRVVDLKARRVLGSLPGLVRYLGKNRPRAMLSTMAHANIVAVLAARLSGAAPGVLALREAVFLGVNSENSRELRGRLLPWLVRLFYPLADALVANAEGAAGELRRILKSDTPVHVIPNPVDVRLIARRAEERIDSPLLSQIDGPLVLGIGRLTAQKDFKTLVEAFALLQERETGASLVILGEGEQRPALERAAKAVGVADRVHLPGFVSNPYRFLKRASVFVLSSRWEGLPNALIEAIAMGTPVVSTDCPSGPAEILENGKYGRLVPVGDAEALAAAMEATLESPPDPDLLRRRGQDFSVERIVKRYLKVLLP